MLGDDTAQLALLTGIQRGDPQVLTAFDARVRPRLIAFGLKRGLQRQDAEDVAQDTLVAAIRQIQEGKFENRGTLAAWTGSIFSRRVNDFLRKQYRDQRTLVHFESTDPEIKSAALQLLADTTAETQFFVREVLKALPSRERIVLILNLLDGRPAHEIAQMLRLGIKATEAILTSAKKQFRQLANEVQEKPRPKRLSNGEPL